MGQNVGAELFVNVFVSALAEQVQVEFTKCGRKAYRGFHDGSGHTFPGRGLALRLCAFA
jgi:hypothetical protein